jgi:hypothetical protein
MYEKRKVENKKGKTYAVAYGYSNFYTKLKI